MIKVLLLFIFCLSNSALFAQTPLGVFDRIMKETKDFKFDTSAVPNDKISRKIAELRKLRGGFNINEAIEFKLAEERQKNEVPKAELDQLESFFKYGDGKRWLNNATSWIYRKHFSYSEIKQLVKFYKTPAGRKMAADFPIIMMQTLAAGEGVKALFEQTQKSKR